MYRIAVICGATPLFLGLSIFLLWWWTRHEMLIVAGILTIYLGTAVVFLGTVALLRYAWTALRSDAPEGSTWRAIVGAGALLFINFPAAAAVTAAAIAIETTYWVVIHNRTEAAFDGVRVFGAGYEAQWGRLEAGQQMKRSIRPAADGPLSFAAISGEREYTAEISPYVTPNLADYRTVTIHADGKIKVEVGPPGN